MKKAVIVVSGGMDSAMITGIAKKRDYELYLLHLNYGQLTEKREQKAFYDISKFYNVKETRIIDTRFLRDIGGSSLVGDGIIPESKSIADITKRTDNDIPSTYVPFRNGIIICFAVAWAEKISAEKVFIGVIEVDSSGYPDCRNGFYQHLNEALSIGTKNKIMIETPLIHKTKADVVRLGTKLNVPFELTWSCYQNEDIPCGKCESCLLRMRGFKQAGIKDPLKKKNLL